MLFPGDGTNVKYPIPGHIRVSTIIITGIIVLVVFLQLFYSKHIINLTEKPLAKEGPCYSSAES